MFEGFANERKDINGVTINYVIKGGGAPLLLLHGYPQTHVMWHKIAPELAQRYTVVAADLRGYGDSSKPVSDDKHLVYSKRSTAADQVALMESLGFKTFMVAGHDRGARVTHRLCLDYPDRVTKAALLDIIPTTEVFKRVDKFVATHYYHWFFLIQPNDLPETLIGANPEFYLRRMATRKGQLIFTDEAFAEYLRCFGDPGTIHATCEDYRAGASIDLEHHEADDGRKIACPVLILWGEKGLAGYKQDPIAIWHEYAADLRGLSVPNGHFLPEESPRETLAALREFFGA